MECQLCRVERGQLSGHLHLVHVHVHLVHVHVHVHVLNLILCQIEKIIYYL